MTNPNDFFPSKIIIQGQEFEFDFDSDLFVNRADLDSEFCEQAKRFATYSTGYEMALEESAKTKIELERLCAHLDHRGRMEAKTAGFKMTDKMADGYVKGHVDYLAKNEELLHRQKITGLLKQAKDAMIHRKDMLIQLGYSQRQERASDISMKEQVYKG